MKLSASFVLAAALAASGTFANAWGQVTTRSVTVVNPPPSVSNSTTTTTTTEEVPSPPTHTTIVFKHADSRDIHTDVLRTWDDFAQAHPKIASTLAYQPSLINDPSYMRRHPSLDAFFQSHPDVKEAMVEDPGNFAAIPPRPGE